MKKRIRVSDIKLKIDNAGIDSVKERVAGLLRIPADRFIGFRLTKKALDARKKDGIIYVFSAELELDLPKDKWPGLLAHRQVSECAPEPGPRRAGFVCRNRLKRIVVVGCGPAGIFAALTLAEAGLAPIIIERGKRVEERAEDIKKFLSSAVLDCESNILFGEGGAGAYSDGKLTTGIKDERIRKVLNELVYAGADEDIRYDSRPHIGTDRLMSIISALRGKIMSLGGEFLFGTRLDKLLIENGALRGISLCGSGGVREIDCDFLILAIGNSAADTLRMLAGSGLETAQKAFSVGVRIEHPREFIDKAQYGEFAKKLPAADYKLNMLTKSGRGVYTFCMCPGGVVIPSVNAPAGLCVNGMSNHARNGLNSNSALLVSVKPGDYCKNESDCRNPLAGLDYRETLEAAAFRLGGGGYRAPVTLVRDFIESRASNEILSVAPSYKPAYTLTDISLCLEPFIIESLKEALEDMDKKIKGFAMGDAVLTAVETRSSSPVKILRGGDFSSSIKGVYPCGEGGGFAGGIMSSAVDGIKTAEALCDAIALL